MTRQRRYFFLLLCVLACSWAAVALFVQSIRFEHRNLILAIRGAEGERPYDPSDAIADYRRALALTSCNVPMRRELVLLFAYQEAAATAGADLDKADEAAAATQDSLSDLLACTPMDGKAWLDYAMVDIHREGFSPRAVAAYGMSRKVSPGESWLAQKRLIFALPFLPLLDANSKTIARADLVTLEHAHGIHLKGVLDAAKLNKNQVPELYAMFGAPLPPAFQPAVNKQK